MIALARRLPKPHFVRPRLAISSRPAVALAFVTSFVLMFAFVSKNVSRMPMHDEFSNALYFFHDIPFKAYWSQHNEHRIPLPRVLYFAAIGISGHDFRAPPILSMVLLSAAVAFFLFSMRRLRGSWALADAALPLGLLTIGQFENLLWGFQVQFIASTSLVIVALGIVAHPGVARSPIHVFGLGLCGGLLPLCGMNGIAFAPGIAVGLLFAGVSNLASRHRRAGLVALAWSLAIAAVCAAYFRGFVDPPHHTNAHGSLSETAIGAVNLLGAAFGPVVRSLPAQPHNGVAVFGLLGVGLVVATGLLLVRGTFDPERRVHAVLAGGVLVGFLGLALGIAKGRAGLSNVLDPNRYVSLMLPMVAGAYAIWTAFGFKRPPRLLALVVVACAIPNALIGWREGQVFANAAKRVEADVRAGMPLEFVADRNTAIYPNHSAHRRDFLTLLRNNGVAPFRDATPMPDLREEPVPIRIVKLQDAVEDDGWIRVTGESGTVVIALPRRQRLYGFKLIYSADPGTRNGIPNLLSWAPHGERPTHVSQVSLNQMEPSAAPAETLIWVQGEVDSLRIDPFGTGARIRIHELVLLSRPSP